MKCQISIHSIGKIQIHIMFCTLLHFVLRQFFCLLELFQVDTQTFIFLRVTHTRYKVAVGLDFIMNIRDTCLMITLYFLNILGNHC